MMSFVQHSHELLLFFAIALSPVFFCLWVLSITLYRTASGLVHCGLVTLLIWCSVQTSISLILGAFNTFNLDGILIAEFSTCILGCILLRKTHQLLPKLSISGTIESIGIHEGIVIFTGVLIGVTILIQSALTPMNSYDSLAYHLPAMAKWYQTGHFTILEQFKSELIGYYPYSWEAFCTLFMFPFREDFLVFFPNVITWLILGASVYQLSVRFSAQRFYALTSSLFVLTLPLLVLTVNSLHVDLPFAAFFITGLYFLLLWWESRLLSDFLLFLLSLGMMLGIKTSAIPYGLVLIASILFFKFFIPKKRGQRKRNLPWFYWLNSFTNLLAVICIPLTLLLGGFWYARNLILFKNPFGLIKVGIANIQLFPGAIEIEKIRQTTLASAFNGSRAADWILVAKQVLLQFGLPFVFIVLQLLVFATIVLWRPKLLKPDSGSSVALLSFLVLCCLVLYYKTPYSGSNDSPPQLTSWMGQGLRYFFPGVALLGVLAAIGSSLIGLRKELLTAACLLSSLKFFVNYWL